MPGARLLLHLIHCTYRRCRHYDAAERERLELSFLGDVLYFNRFPVLLIRSHLAALNDELGSGPLPAW